MKTASRYASFWATTITTIAVVVAMILGAPNPAWADPDTSVAHYEAGRKQYKLGQFAEAIKLFSSAYDEYPDPAYLFNIAQSHRKLEHCEPAVVFYRRFLSASPGAPNRAKVEAHVSELVARCPAAGKSSASSSSEADSSSDEIRSSAATPENGAVADGQDDPPLLAGSENRGGLSVAAGLGAAVFDLGDVVTPTVAALRIGARYALVFGSFAAGGGVSAQLSSLPYATSMGDDGSRIDTLLVEGHGGYTFSDRLTLGAELGLGLLMWSGLGPGNPFASDGAELGSQSSIALRIAGTAEYRIRPAWSIGLSAARIQASAGDGLRMQISSIARTEFLGGIRYHL